MKVIGITGGVGAGKSAVLDYIEANFRAKVLKADEIAHTLMAPGSRCYETLKGRLPERLFLEDGTIDKTALGEAMFSNDELREQINEIVHPAVKVYILDMIAKEKKSGTVDYLMVEAALLIEDGYEKICDELWYVYASEEQRKKRLMESRGYTERQAERIFSSQLSEGAYRKHCRVVIENDKTLENACYQVTQALSEKGDTEMDMRQLEERLVFGLDIGTRNIVGTVGYKEEDEFYVVAQYVKEHETRSMLDGQIHDIGRVGRSISVVKRQLEHQLGITLHEVCIAAAGRVLKTVTTSVEYEFEEDTVVEREHIHTLELLGVEKAQQILNENNDTKFRFYSVGYSVMKYYVNEEVYSNLESHKARRISADIIVTFLPEEVVDDLYSAVDIAGLKVASLTLEPIAAINVAIPETFRMLNIALVDVGAGTSDISVTRDGSIIAYGMIPSAGDEITEMLVQHYLVDFKTAEHIKLESGVSDEITYMDIMSISHTIPAEEVWELTAPLVEKLVKEIAAKIKELNGEESVSATFVVGGGGKVHDFVKLLSQELELPQERVALRGEEVLREVHFIQKDIKKDPLLVTPIGICLNFYDQRNNFIFARFNGERIKLYDNGKLTIVDAALEAGFPKEQLFPRRGREINFTLDGKSRIARGEAGESAIVRVNGSVVNINTPLEQNSEITIEPSTVGTNAVCRLDELEEYRISTLTFEVNGRVVHCPKFFEVNGSLEPPFYQIQEGDRIDTRSFYTVGQVMEFMDVELDSDRDILVNNRPADLDTLVYENFSIEWTVLSFRTPESEVAKSRPNPAGGSKGQGAAPAKFEWPFGLGREIAQRKKKEAEEKEKAVSKEEEASVQENGQNAGDTNESQDEAVKEPQPKEETEALPDTKEAPDLSEDQEQGPTAQEPEHSKEEAVEEEIHEIGQKEENTELSPESSSELKTAQTRQDSKEETAGKEQEADSPKAEAASRQASDHLVVGLNREPAKGSGHPHKEQEMPEAKEDSAREEGNSITVTANQETVTLTGKESYVLVDIFEYISFDLNSGNGRRIIVNLNGDSPSYMQELKDGDVIEVYWQEK